MSMTANDFDRLRRDHPLAAAALLVAAGAGGAVLLAPWVDADAGKALYGAAITLVFAAFLGGLVKLLMDDAAAVRKRRENAAEFVINVLADLKEVYDRVGRARIVIPAHRSARTYGDEMRDIIDARVQLLNVIRAVTQRADGVSPRVLKTVNEQACEMEKYLARLTSEFTVKYKGVSDLQAAYETWAAEARKAAATTDAAVRGKLAEQPADPWPALEALPCLKELMDGGSSWKSSFETPLAHATAALRGELATVLGSRRGDTLWDQSQRGVAEQAQLATR